MTSQPDALLTFQPAHLPHYTHSAAIIGSVMILAIITLMAGLALAIAHHLALTVPITHRDQSPRLVTGTVRDVVRSFLTASGVTKIFRNPGSTEMRFFKDETTATT